MVQCNVLVVVIFRVLVQVVLIRCSEKGDDSCTSFPNVGTVLFHTEDTQRRCWVDCDMLLLQARWIAQSLIPRGKVKAQTDAYVAAYINYVTNNFETTGDMTKGLPQQMMVMVLADIHGGYLRSVLLPITREAFYSGTVSYKEAIKLFQLYECLKALLRTDGMGWRRVPCRTAWEHVKAQALRAEESPASKQPRHPCEDFINPLDKTSNTTGGKLIGAKPSNCTSSCKITTVKPVSKTQNEAEKSIVIPIPFLDDKEHPHSVAVPLRPLSLHSLDSALSESLITKYYLSATRCLLARGASKAEKFDFNRQFRRWLESEVIPHLREETFYPGFGGVLRVVESMVALGFESVEQDVLMPVPNEPRRSNALRSLLQQARLQGQGSWNAFKVHRSSGTHDQRMLAARGSGGSQDDDSNDQRPRKLAPLHNPSKGYVDCTTKCTSRRAVMPVSQSCQSEQVSQGLRGHGPADMLLCVVLGMLGTLLLWIICACCYCIFLRVKDRRVCYDRSAKRCKTSCTMKHREYASLIPQSGKAKPYHSNPLEDLEIDEHAEKCGPTLCDPVLKGRLICAECHSASTPGLLKRMLGSMKKCFKKPVVRRPCVCNHGYATMDPHFQDDVTDADMDDEKLPLSANHWDGPSGEDLTGPPPCRVIMLEPECPSARAEKCPGSKSLETIPSVQSVHHPPAPEQPARRSSSRRRSLPHAIPSRRSNHPLGSW